MERPTRARAQWIAKARAGQSEAFEPLVRLLGGETNALWRAVVAGLLKGWPHHAPGTTALLKAIGDRDPLVRTMAARSLEPLAATDNRAVSEALERLLRDPVRSVRVEAAWGLRATLDTNCPAAADLFTYLAQNVDQPSGLLQVGVFHLDRGEVQTALPFLEKAVQWDKASAPLRHALAVALSLQGRRREAVRELETACKLAPREAEYRFKLGLALNETGRLDDALSALAEAVKLEPRFAQAWYNLGLAYSAAGQTDSALDALIRAESLDPSSAQAPYARATILARLRRLEEARAAVRRALELQPNHPEARTLMQLLTPR
jgi:tetratricopeptide (TPR) repeat protein